MNIDDHVRYLKERVFEFRQLEEQLLALKRFFEGIPILKAGHRWNKVHLQVEKSSLPQLRKRGLQWERSEIEMDGVVDASKHLVAFKVPIAGRVWLEWWDTYEPGPTDKCQWKEAKDTGYTVPERTYTTLECAR